MIEIIVNEKSGSGAGAKVLQDVKALLDEENIPYRAHATDGPGHAARLADQAVTESAEDVRLVAVGGDGTIFEIVNGLAGRFATVYFVPCGTGNDFVKMLNLPKDPVEALRLQLHGERRRIDVGKVNEHYFLNVSGSGFDVEVLRQAARFKRFGKGLLPYLLGIFAALRQFQPLSVEMTCDGRSVHRELTIFSVGNGSYIGGGMKALPHAKIDDGLFDVFAADRVGRISILRFLSKFVSGKHMSLPIAHEWRCSALTVQCPGMVLDIDGELIPADEARYEILPGALGVCLPAGQADE